jgi:hypothetical protein
VPERIQLRRTKGWRMPEGAIKVDRSTSFGNPFPLLPHTQLSEQEARIRCIAQFEEWLDTHREKYEVEKANRARLRELEATQAILVRELEHYKATEKGVE